MTTIIITAIVTTIVWYLIVVKYISAQNNGERIPLRGFIKSIKDKWHGKLIPVDELKVGVVYHVIFRRDVGVPGFLCSTDLESIICLSDMRCYITCDSQLPQTIKDNTRIIIFDDDSKLTPDQEKLGIIPIRRYITAHRTYFT